MQILKKIPRFLKEDNDRESEDSLQKDSFWHQGTEETDSDSDIELHPGAREREAYLKSFDEMVRKKYLDPHQFKAAEDVQKAREMLQEEKVRSKVEEMLWSFRIPIMPFWHCMQCGMDNDHQTDECPNVGKDREKYTPLRPCPICLKGGHFAGECLYRLYLPPGAEVGPGVEVNCFYCGEREDKCKCKASPGDEMRKQAWLPPKPPLRCPICCEIHSSPE